MDIRAFPRLSAVQKWNVNQHYDFKSLTFATGLNWDIIAAPLVTVTATGNFNVNSPSSARAGMTCGIQIVQGATGSNVGTWAATSFEFAGQSAPTLSTTSGSVDFVSFYYTGTIFRELGRSLDIG